MNRASSHESVAISIEGNDKVETTLRALLSAVITLTLGILGSSVLPVPFAFSRTGVLLGMLTAVVVASANCHTSVLVLRAAGKTGHDSYEGVAEAVGGRRLKVLTQVSLILLLFGTIVGDFALISDVAARALDKLTYPAEPPSWLLNGDGRALMAIIAVLLVFPLCCLRRMRSLEMAAAAGVAVIAVIISMVVYTALHAGLPAIRSGELPLWGMKVTKDLPEAFAVLGFAFYLQPMMMPLLHEMPAGDLGVQLTSTAVRIVVPGVALAVYCVLGVFAAARFGLDTQGDMLLNSWVGGKWEGVVDLAMTVYLSISIPPMQMSLRYTVDCMLAGEDALYNRKRHICETVGILVPCLMVAMVFPAYAEKIFAITGATAVCLVCYVIPVAIHLRMYYDSKRPMQFIGCIE
ncbi:hypothetical protein WJX72_002950 [[Myrmecia] bisecta]|uniref:Amino acid transporter transmembrane domain-containing protein n=1 Tax=[Myrmecia] bisecta TaxID=41462 RepID=A0AAW1Q9S6_9CHLO